MRVKAKKIMTSVAIGTASCLLVAQFVTIRRTNPPLKGDLAAPPQVKSLLREACYDCHSNETRWPWYTYIAPVSWLAETRCRTRTPRAEFLGVGILLSCDATAKTSMDGQSVARRDHAAMEVSPTASGRRPDAGRPCRAGTMDRVRNCRPNAKKTRESGFKVKDYLRLALLAFFVLVASLWCPHPAAA